MQNPSEETNAVTNSNPIEETDVAATPDPPVDLGALKYGPVGTGWLKFLIYIGLPVQAILNYLGLSSINVTHLSGSIAYVSYFLLIAYGVSFPLVTAFFLHLRHPRGYFLINYLLFSNALLNLCLVFLFPDTISNLPFSYMQASVSSIFWGLVWFFYIKKRRFLFEKENMSKFEFENIGIKISYIIVPAFAVAVASLAYLAYQ